MRGQQETAQPHGICVMADYKHDASAFYFRQHLLLEELNETFFQRNAQMTSWKQKGETKQ